MYEIIVSFVLSFILVLCATPIARKIAIKAGAVDTPKDSRRMHKKSMPLMGGLAIVFAFVTTLLINVLGDITKISSGFDIDYIRFGGFILGILIIVICGILDDMYKIKARYKFLFQLSAAIIVVLSGTRIAFITNPFSDSWLTNLPTFLSIIFSIIWIVGVTNAINFIDGLDGLAAGVCFIASLSLFFVSIVIGGMSVVSILTATLAGSALGFLPYNFNPAKIFMGETGSAFLGFTLAFISIQGTLKFYAAIAIAIPILILGIPLFDTIFAILRRTFSGKSFAEADRGHLHHRLVDMGLSQKQSVIVLYAISAVLGLSAIVLADKGPLPAIILILVLSLLLIGVSKFIGLININPNRNLESTFLMNTKQQKNIIPKNPDETLKVITVFGTRPDAIKMVPLIKELETHNNIVSIICATGQHREMLDQVLDIFKIVPDYDLDIMKERQTLQYITTSIIEGLTAVLEKERPDIVLVHGDTGTCFAASLSAFYLQIPVGHVEAGLRTFDKYFPFPEEMNRKLTGCISELHFSPTLSNKNNLLNEGIPENSIYITGNTGLDALKLTVSDDYKFQNELLESINFEDRRVITVEAHRRENLGEPLENICKALKFIADSYDDVEIVYPVHLNPAVQEVAAKVLDNHPRIHLINPLDVKEMHNLMYRSYMIMTDSGGLQEEVPSLGKPVLVLRNETERPEAVRAGTVKLAGVDTETIIKLAKELLDNKKEYDKMSHAINPYGDGFASKRIVDALLFEFGLTSEIPEEFLIN